MLFFLRASGLIVASPVFGRKSVPNLIKITFCLVMAYFIFTAVPPPETVYSSPGVLPFILQCACELLFGIVIGFVTTMFFNLTFVAGQLIDTQIGFSIVSVYDVQNRTQVPLIGNLLNIVMLLVFYAVGGHHKLITILMNTFYQIPVGHVALSVRIAAAAAESFALSFTLGVMVALPVIASGLVLEVVLGVLIRTVPQMNMFVVGIPVKLIVGLVVLMFALPVFVYFNQSLFDQMFQSIEKMFSALRPA